MKDPQMSMEGLQRLNEPPRGLTAEPARGRTASSYEGELTRNRCAEQRLLQLLAGEKALNLQKDDVIQQQEIQYKESSHRLLNGLQMIASVLSLQGRSSQNSETSSQLAVAANRVAMIERVHRRLHCFDGADSIPLQQFLQDLCLDFSMMVSSNEQPERAIAVQVIDIQLPTTKGIPLGFIVSELLMNAAKHGQGRILVELGSDGEHGYQVSVSNGGLALPRDFNAAASKGLGMKIIRSLVQRIGGTLEYGQLETGVGARFIVRFTG